MAENRDEIGRLVAETEREGVQGKITYEIPSLFELTVPQGVVQGFSGRDDGGDDDEEYQD